MSQRCWLPRGSWRLEHNQCYSLFLFWYLYLFNFAQRFGRKINHRGRKNAERLGGKAQSGASLGPSLERKACRMTLAGPVIHLAPARHWMPEIPKFRPPGPEPHFLIGNFPLGSRDPLGLLATWAHQFGDIFYYRAGWIHVYFLNHPDHIESVLLTHHQNFVKDRVIRNSRWRPA